MPVQVQALYKAAKKRFDAEPEFKARAREAVTQLQSGNELFLQARLFCVFQLAELARGVLSVQIYVRAWTAQEMPI